MSTLNQLNHYALHKIVKPMYLVAIGGSAGFLKPLLTFFDHTPNDMVSYIILRHIGRNVRSELEQILQMHCLLTVVDATQNMKVENNKVYVLPTGFYMTIKEGRLQLHERMGLQNCAIDIFMESLAKEYKKDAIGIILSGTGANGAKGIQSIKQEGGKVFVQEPSSCEYDAMPRNAIKTGCVDAMLLPQEMPRMIAKHVLNVS